MYADLTYRDDNITPKVTPVHDRLTPGVRITFGSLYFSLDDAEAAELAAGLLTALAELKRIAAAPELVRDEDEIRTAAEIREAL
ncbi:hypothetical protein BTZ20_4476 [Rhodococcus sp. MTM3W5.2]|uniref:hypothetical protein n=1 Tax=Rhodococcus sp. MTM3W5.2 TaxID=1805827 RepID=UPI0009792222|nr:hypothetical protein [Rhodococcus sp. MTM3W5.2]AQA22493.1 hypothetical protein BTZ20_4476 [Rhodococcus sp. MTM3W5.2]